MHNIFFIRRRFPEHANSIIALLLLGSISALAIGIGLLLF